MIWWERINLLELSQLNSWLVYVSTLWAWDTVPDPFFSQPVRRGPLSLDFDDKKVPFCR